MVRVTIQVTNKTAYLENVYVIDLFNDGKGTPEKANYNGRISDFNRLTATPFTVEDHVRPEGLLVLVKKAIEAAEAEIAKT